MSSESELLSGAREFDLLALAAIYDRYSPGLYGYALRLLGDASLAEDCVAETFARLLKGLRAGRGPRDYLQAYLYRVAHNWITDQYRRQPPGPLPLPDELPAGDGARPDWQAELRLDRQRVRAALGRLTPDQRMVVTLRFIEGWENEAVAQALEKPVGAVKALQHRALQSLRRWLQDGEAEYAHGYQHGT